MFDSFLANIGSGFVDRSTMFLVEDRFSRGSLLGGDQRAGTCHSVGHPVLCPEMSRMWTVAAVAVSFKVSAASAFSHVLS